MGDLKNRNILRVEHLYAAFDDWVSSSARVFCFDSCSVIQDDSGNHKKERSDALKKGGLDQYTHCAMDLSRRPCGGRAVGSWDDLLSNRWSDLPVVMVIQTPYASLSCFLRAGNFPEGRGKLLLADPQQVLPVAKFSLKAQALGDPETCDDAPFDLLAGLSAATSLPKSWGSYLTRLTPAPSHEGDDRTDQEHNSGSDRDNSNPLPDPALFPFHPAACHQTHAFQHFLSFTPFAKYANCRSQIPACDLSYDRCGPSGSQSPIRNNSSHCRNSPLKPILSTIRNVEMTHRSICLPDFPAVSHVRRYYLHG